MADQNQSAGDNAQVRKIAEQVADAAISRFVSQHPEVRRGTVVSEIPPPIKWAALVASAVLTVSATAGLIWLVTNVSETNVTLARIDERMAAWTQAQELRMNDHERRIQDLEDYHREGGR